MIQELEILPKESVQKNESVACKPVIISYLTLWIFGCASIVVSIIHSGVWHKTNNAFFRTKTKGLKRAVFRDIFQD